MSRPQETKLIWIQSYKLVPWLLLQQDKANSTDKKHQPQRETHRVTYISVKGQWALGSGAPEIEKMVKSGLHTSSGRRDLVHFEYFKTETKTETHISIFELMAKTFWWISLNRVYIKKKKKSVIKIIPHQSYSLSLFQKLYSALTKQEKTSSPQSLQFEWSGTPGNLWIM